MKGALAINVMLDAMEYNRTKTLKLLDELRQSGRVAEILGWRPGAGRAHIAWQLVHIGVTEEVFATERLHGQTPAFADLVPRFKAGSTPDDQIPDADLIRQVLQESRVHLRSALSTFCDDDLGIVPEAFRERGWTLGYILQVLCWHEGHHQGQAHLTHNLWKNRG